MKNWPKFRSIKLSLFDQEGTRPFIRRDIFHVKSNYVKVGECESWTNSFFWKLEIFLLGYVLTLCFSWHTNYTEPVQKIERFEWPKQSEQENWNKRKHKHDNKGGIGLLTYKTCGKCGEISHMES